MTGQAFFVLAALADGPRHGYGIVGDVAELSQGRVKLKIGSLYGVLERLAAEGLIEPDREEARGGRLRRYYRLTQDGRRELAQEAELRAATARVVRARLNLAGPATDMPFQRRPRLLSVLASALAAGTVLALAGCSHITPLGPGPGPVGLPPARDLGSPI